MLYWALVFLIIAIIAALFGFAGVATAAVGIAKLLFYIFLVDQNELSTIRMESSTANSREAFS